METEPLVTDSDDQDIDFDAMGEELFGSEPSVAPESSEPDPEPEQAPPSEPETPGQPRDDSGRFAPKQGDVPAPAGSPAPPSALPEPTPFRFRSSGQEVAIEGAHVTPSGDLVIPKSAVAQAQQLFARGHEQATVGRQREAQFQRQLREAQEEAKRPSEAQVRANVVATELAKVLDSDDELVKFINDPQGYRESLRLRVENQMYRQTAQMQQDRQSARSQQEQQEHVQQMQAEQIPTMVREFSELPELKGKLTAEDLAHAEQHFSAFAGQLVRPATREEAQSLGVQEGSLIRVQEPIYRHLMHLAATRDQYKAQQKAMADAAKHNAALTAKPKGPPVVGSGSKSAAVPEAKPGRKDDDKASRAKRALLSMKLEDLED